MDRSEQKAELRKMLLERREQISPAKYREHSDLITERLIKLACYQEAKTVHCYFSRIERKEVDTTSLIGKILDDEKRLVLPVMKFSPPRLEHMEPDSPDSIQPNPWGVPEPTKGSMIDTDELDLVVVPMVGGDRRLNRLGYGKGYYDRFLKEVDCPRVGLCFGSCMVDEIPEEKFDIKMDKIITEAGLIEEKEQIGDKSA